MNERRMNMNEKKLRSISEPWLMYENEVLWSDEMLIK